MDGQDKHARMKCQRCGSEELEIQTAGAWTFARCRSCGWVPGSQTYELPI